MEYNLKKELQVYDKESGEYVGQSKVNVSFTGKKGLKTIKRLQDVIFKAFQETSAQNKGTAETTTQNDNITTDEVFDLLEMMGQSEKMFDEVTGALKSFAVVGDKKLDEALQEQMDIEDLDGLYREVLKTFLLPKITSKLNSMKR